MLVSVVILSALACLMALAAVGLGVVTQRKALAESASIRDMLLSLSRRDVDALTVPTASYLPERPVMSPEAALAYYQSLASSPLWAPLAHRFQVDTRDRLVQARIQSEAGRPYAAMLHVGGAWYASQMAILCEREIAVAQKQVERKAAEKRVDEQLASVGDHRPARY